MMPLMCFIYRLRLTNVRRTKLANCVYMIVCSICFDNGQILKISWSYFQGQILNFASSNFQRILKVNLI